MMIGGGTPCASAPRRARGAARGGGGGREGGEGGEAATLDQRATEWLGELDSERLSPTPPLEASSPASSDKENAPATTTAVEEKPNVSTNPFGARLL